MKRIVVVLVVLALLVPGVVLAQGDVTLEGLAERVLDLSGRVETLEGMWKPAPVVDEEGVCQLAVGATQWNGREGGMHPITMAAYLVLSDGQIPRQVQIDSVSVSPTGVVGVRFATYQDKDVGAFSEYGAYVVEYWNGCEFQYRSSFWEEDRNGDITYLADPE